MFNSISILAGRYTRLIKDVAWRLTHYLRVPSVFRPNSKRPVDCRVIIGALAPVLEPVQPVNFLIALPSFSYLVFSHYIRKRKRNLRYQWEMFCETLAARIPVFINLSSRTVECSSTNVGEPFRSHRCASGWWVRNVTYTVGSQTYHGALSAGATIVTMVWAWTHSCLNPDRTHKGTMSWFYLK